MPTERVQALRDAIELVSKADTHDGAIDALWKALALEELDADTVQRLKSEGQQAFTSHILQGFRTGVAPGTTHTIIFSADEKIIDLNPTGHPDVRVVHPGWPGWTILVPPFDV